MDYDATSVPSRYHAARELPDAAMRRWLAAIGEVAPLAPGAAVADVGCGTGRFCGGLAELYRCRVLGLDPSLAMLREARARNREGWFCAADAAALPLPPGSLQMIFLSNVIHHLADLRAAARGFARVLEPRGFVVVRNYLREELGALPYLEFFPEATRLSLTILGSKAEVEAAFASAGFRLYSQRSVEQPAADSPTHYLDKIRSRVYSDLATISDEAFAAGVARMRDAVAAGWGRPLVEPVALLGFQRSADS